MDRDRDSLDRFPPSTIEDAASLRSIREEDGRNEDHMVETTAQPLLHDQLPTSQRPVSITGWSLIIVAGLLLWVMIFHLIG